MKKYTDWSSVDHEVKKKKTKQNRSQIQYVSAPLRWPICFSQDMTLRLQEGTSRIHPFNRRNNDHITPRRQSAANQRPTAAPCFVSAVEHSDGRHESLWVQRFSCAHTVFCVTRAQPLSSATQNWESMLKGVQRSENRQTQVRFVCRRFVWENYCVETVSFL